MPDYPRMLKMNPALLVKRIEALETTIERQFALNDAASKRLVDFQEELAQKGAFIVALLQKLGGRCELTPAELRALQESNLKVNFAYPTAERDTFLMVLSADGGDPSDERIREIEAKLRAEGYSDAEIRALRESLDAQGDGEPPNGSTPPPAEGA